MSLWNRDELDTTIGHPIPTVSIQICWNCENLQAELGKYSSKGPMCAECEEYMETYSIIGS
jgi:hypothetical protein